MKAVDISTALTFKTRLDWRTWLEQHHETSSGVWLVHYKKSLGKKILHHFDTVEEAICYGWIDSTLKKIDDDRFILRYTPRKPTSVWSKINKDKAEQMIAQGKMMPAGFQTIEEAKKRGIWQAAYTNKVKDKLPSALKKALMKHPTAWKNFQNFANSYRNQYIGWVNNAKTEQTRQHRIEQVVRWSAENKKPGMP